MTFTDNILAILTFDHEKILILANDEKATNQAISIAFLAALFSFMPPLLDFLTLDNEEVKTSALLRGISTFLTIFFIFILFSYTITFVLHGFGRAGTLIQCLRVFGFSQIWTLLGYFIDLILTTLTLEIQLSFATSLGLIGLVVFIFGLTIFSNISTGSALMATTIAFIISLITTLLLVNLIQFFITLFLYFLI
ncbi:MAG: hypothetical protein ACTSW1_06835 [Candidatus Hodarchaeales archaeon]